VLRNTEELAESLARAINAGEDRSLEELGVAPAEALADLERLVELVHSRQPEQETELEALHMRYIRARAPRKDQQATIAYRLRMLSLDRWELWRRLTLYRRWEGSGGERIDGTNNGAERAIGWWIKERYRPMRGYKRIESILNVSRLITWMGNHLATGGADLAMVVA